MRYIPIIGGYCVAMLQRFCLSPEKIAVVLLFHERGIQTCGYTTGN
jgi:hypothetical protein